MRYLLFFVVLLNGCAGGQVSILDKEQCADEGSLGAHCAKEFSGATRDIDQPEWDNTRFGWFCMDPSDTLESKKEAEELCSIKGVSCSYPAKTNIQNYVHHHFVFMAKMKSHAREAWRKTHGLEAVYPRSIQGIERVDSRDSGLAPRLDDAATQDVP